MRMPSNHNIQNNQNEKHEVSMDCEHAEWNSSHSVCLMLETLVIGTLSTNDGDKSNKK